MSFSAGVELRKQKISDSKDEISLSVTKQLIKEIEQGFQGENRCLIKEAKLSRMMHRLNVELANIFSYNQTPKKQKKEQSLLELLERAEMLRKQIAFDAIILKKSTLDWMIKRRMAKALICNEVQKIGSETDALKESIENDCFNVSPAIQDRLFSLRNDLAEFEWECLTMPEPDYFNMIDLLEPENFLKCSMP